MEFRIASTFTDSVARLTGDEQRAAKTTAFDLQIDPSGAGHSFHKLDRAKDRNFWSVRVSRDIRHQLCRAFGFGRAGSFARPRGDGFSIQVRVLCVRQSGLREGMSPLPRLQAAQEQGASGSTAGKRLEVPQV